MKWKSRMSKKVGKLIIISGPSGVGKGTVCNELRLYKPNLKYSISATTRLARTGETHGVNYYFLTMDKFKEMVQQNLFLEYAQVYGNYYGTPRENVEELLDAGYDVILEIDIQGAFQVKEKFPQGVFIFIMPPSIDELRNRIVSRGTESEESLANRLGSVESEIKCVDKYDYLVVNDDLDRCVREIEAIITAEQCRVQRNKLFIKELLTGSDK